MWKFLTRLNRKSCFYNNHALWKLLYAQTDTTNLRLNFQQSLLHYKQWNYVASWNWSKTEIIKISRPRAFKLNVLELPNFYCVWRICSFRKVLYMRTISTYQLLFAVLPVAVIIYNIMVSINFTNMIVIEHYNCYTLLLKQFK